MPRIYVACLAAYNNGHLHGQWIDATSDQTEMSEAVQAMLTKSPVADAEEYAIHDMEGLPPSFGEYVGLDTVAAYVSLLEDFDYLDEDVIAAVYDNFRNLEETRSALEDNFVGIYSSFQDYADEAANEWLASLDIKDDNPLMRYFDYEAFARDLAFDMMTVETAEGVAIFHNS